MDNAIVVDDLLLNADGLRYDDEFVKHKVLDAIVQCRRPDVARYTGVSQRPWPEQEAMRKLFAEAVRRRRGRDVRRCVRGAAGVAALAPAW